MKNVSGSKKAHDVGRMTYETEPSLVNAGFGGVGLPSTKGGEMSKV